MKKLALVLILLLAVSGATLFAQAVSLSSLPSGSWVDKNENWDGTWTFSSTGITIRDNQTGTVTGTYNLGNMQNLKAVTSGATAGISFYSADNGKTFAFYANPVGGSMVLTIDREGQAQYRATMPKQ